MEPWQSLATSYLDLQSVAYPASAFNPMVEDIRTFIATHDLRRTADALEGQLGGHILSATLGFKSGRHDELIASLCRALVGCLDEIRARVS